MNREQLQMINKEIYRRFPEVKDNPPKVERQDIAKTRSISKPITYLLIYKGKVLTAGQKTLPRLVRVVVNEDGKILKVTTSH